MQNETGTRTILIVEDEPDIREGVRIRLNGEGYNIIEAGSGEEALDQMNEAVDLVILDIMLPGISGLKVCKEIRRVSAVPILFLTARSQESDKTIGLLAGGDDYLAKPFSMLEMVSRIRAVLRRSGAADLSSRLRLGRLEMDPDAHTVLVDGERVELTLKEFELVRLFLKHPGRVYSRDQLLEKVWGGEYFGETRTVDVHIGTLRTKLGLCGGYVRTVRGVGYRMEERS